MEMTNSPTCLLTFDFTEAFDKIAHKYLFKALEHWNTGTLEHWNTVDLARTS